MKKAVFISYRRKDSKPYARNIYQRLQFIEQIEVYFDESSTLPGSEYPQEIANALKEVDTVLVVVKDWNRWMGRRDYRDILLHQVWRIVSLKRPVPPARLIDDPDDWVRKEIEQAIAHDKKILPIFIGDDSERIPNDLPTSLQKLESKQLLYLRDGQRWESDLEALVENLIGLKSRDSDRGEVSGEAENTKVTSSHIDEPRRVDALLPSQTTIGIEFEVLAQVRLTKSAKLGIDRWPRSMRPENLRDGSDLPQIRFRRNSSGKLEPGDIELRIVAPSFSILGDKRKRVVVPVDSNSTIVGFFLVPKRVGENEKITVEILDTDGKQTGTIFLETNVTSESRRLAAQGNLSSVSLSVRAEREDAAMKSRSFTPNVLPGFSLVELLVVVSIFGILLAMTLPALVSVRSAARNTQCKNNLRQFGICFLNRAVNSSSGEFCSGSFRSQDGAFDTFGWVADCVDQDVLPGQLLCPSSICVGSESWNQLDAIATFAPPSRRDIEFQLDNKQLIEAGYNTNYASSWHMVRSAPVFRNQNGREITTGPLKNWFSKEGKPVTKGPLTMLELDSASAPATAIALLGCGSNAFMDEGVLEVDIAPEFMLTKGSPVARTLGNGPVSVTEFGIIPVEIGTEKSPLEQITIPTRGNVATTKQLFLDTRQWQAWHNDSLTVLFADGSVKILEDSNKDGFINPGFPVDTSRQGEFGYKSSIVEVNPWDLYTGTMLGIDLPPKKFDGIKQNSE